jgi:hypothetical protein
MVVFDANFLLALLDPGLPPPTDPETTKPILQLQARLNHLVADLHKRQEKIIIPTPVLSEILVRAEVAGNSYLAKLSKSAAFKIEPFDTRAAVEVATMTAKAIINGDRKEGSTDTWSKIKYDRQIIAIGRVVGASCIYTNDRGLRNFAGRVGLTTVRLSDLPLPPQDAQTSMENIWAASQEEPRDPSGEMGSW